MKSIPNIKKQKVIKLFFSGFSYDEIAMEVGIAKGSVVNIIDDFRNGELQVMLNEYIENLWELAVDLKKQHTTVKQLKMYVSIQQELTEMDVGVEEVSGWLDIVKDIAAEPDSPTGFVKAALDLARLENETGHGPESLVTEFKEKSDALKKLDSEITQKLATKSKLDKYVTDAKLNWDMVSTVKAILNDKLTKEGWGEEEVSKISKRIAEVGSLVSFIKELENKKQAIQENIELFKEEAHNLEMANTGIKKQVDLESSQAYNLMEGKKKLEKQVKEIEWQVNGLEMVKDGHMMDIYTAWCVVAFLINPDQITNSDFDYLVEMMNGIRLARFGKEPKKVTDATGKIICRCQVPRPYTPMKDYHVAMTKARERLAEYLVTLVEDKFVSKFEYDVKKMTQEILEMKKKLNNLVIGLH